MIKFATWDGVPLFPGILLILLYLLWIVAESKVAVSEIDMKKTSLDKGTLEMYAAARAITVITALATSTIWNKSGIWIYAGITLFIAAVVFRLYAIKMLGDLYSHRVRLKDEHKIIDTGPYKYVRHPAYTGMLLAHTGFVIFFFSIPAFLSLLILYLFVIVRILVEEKMLFSLDGYEAYSKNRKRLMPNVW
ncbi:MAG: isoprenylcysteine carboxylmethyltransferase family protein [Bacteroidota bacterium]